jgi:membrane protease YdiL (CAAX protease family)
LDLLAAGAAYAGLLYLAFALIPPAALHRAESDVPLFFAFQLFDDGILGGVALAFGRFRFPGTCAGLGFRRPRPAWWGLGVGGGLVAALAAWTLSTELDRWGWPPPSHVVESVLGAAQRPRDVLLILAAVSVVVPVAEETFFRGFAYRLLRARFGAAAAIGATSVLFALVHGLQAGAWLPVIPVGLVLAGLVEASGSLWPAVVAHGIVNALAVLAG